MPGIGNYAIRGGNHKGLSSATPIGRSMDGDRELVAEEPLDIRRVRWAAYPDAVGIVSDGTLVHVQVLERLFGCRIDEHTECWEVSCRNHGEFEWGTDVEGWFPVGIQSDVGDNVDLGRCFNKDMPLDQHKLRRQLLYCAASATFKV